MDQATVLRQMKNKGKDMNEILPVIPPGGQTGGKVNKEHTRVISITSGKGGVGKTSIAANLAYIFSSMRRKTLIFDADTGLANIDVILGLTPKFNLHHVLHGEKRLSEVLVKGPGGVMILPSSSGIQEMANLSTQQKLALLDELDEIDDSYDFMLIDTAAGIAGNVMYFNMAAKEIIVVVTPEPTSLTDAYAMIKILYQGHNEEGSWFSSTSVKSAYEAREVFRKLSNAAEHFLDLSVEYLGYLPQDEKVKEAVQKQKAFIELYPRSQASKCLFAIAEKICHEQPVRYDHGSLKFFSKAIVDRDRE